MKKLFIVLMAAMMITFGSGTVFAHGQFGGNGHGYDDGPGMGPGQGLGLGHRGGDGGCGETRSCGIREADINLSGQAFSDDFSTSTSYRGFGNDDATASASGYSGGTMDAFASAMGGRLQFVGWSCWGWPKFERVPNEARTDGTVNADDSSYASSYAYDMGRTSVAGATASTSGYTSTFGVATGRNGKREVVDSTVWVGGQVEQFHNAREVGYNNGWVSGGNVSGGSFYAEDRDHTSGRNYAADCNSISGYANTSGSTTVSIDPFGAHRGLSAHTQNQVNLGASHGMQKSDVYGSGGVGGNVTSGHSYAGGNASFNYTGCTSGSGSADLNANIHDFGSHTSVTVTGSASSVSK